MGDHQDSMDGGHDMPHDHSGSYNEINNARLGSRNPITGMGLNGDGVGGLKPKTAKNRAGNPVTGEGYRAGHTDFEVLRKMSRRPAEYSDGRL